MLIFVRAVVVALLVLGSAGPVDSATRHRRHRTAAVQCHNPARSPAQAHRFMVQTGYPHGRPGWIVDHILPLACCGADRPSNMQWMTVADALAKDKWEIKGDATHKPCSGLPR